MTDLDALELNDLGTQWSVSGGHGIIAALTPLTNISESDLPAIVQRIEEHIDAEAPIEECGFLWTTAFLLMGLKYDPAFSRQLLKGVLEMKESSTYQSILQEGRLDEARRMLILVGGKRFGEPDVQTRAALDYITSQEQLEQLIERAIEVESWQELLQ